MTAPRIISAAEARALLEAATPGPWAVDERVAEKAPCRTCSGGGYVGLTHEIPCPDCDCDAASWGTSSTCAPSRRMTAADAGEAETRAAVLVRDLAASVVALHALLDEAHDIIASQRNPAWNEWCDRVCKIDLEATL